MCIQTAESTGMLECMVINMPFRGFLVALVGTIYLDLRPGYILFFVASDQY